MKNLCTCTGIPVTQCGLVKFPYITTPTPQSIIFFTSRNISHKDLDQHLTTATNCEQNMAHAHRFARAAFAALRCAWSKQYYQNPPIVMSNVSAAETPNRREILALKL
ncbi:hypothetical protein J1614_006890 [Plenodomus biglobosus]|nr:hypothetical protein J1614_006890 [Plenodomus biglobosus]